MHDQPSLRVKTGNWLIPLAVALVTLVAFLPALQNGFVNWDDDQNLLGNLHYRGLGRDELRWMFTTFHMSLYRPLTWVTFGLDHLLWGLNPVGYHLTSLILHAANGLLFYYVTLWLLTLAFAHAPDGIALSVAAGFGALVFAVHPLRVEAVAWASACSASPANRVWWEKLPFLLLAAGIGFVALLAKEQMGAMRSFGQHDIVTRLAQSLHGFAFYLCRTIFPLDLSPLYELPVQFNPWNWSYLLSGALVVVISTAFFLLRRRWPGGLAVWISYLAILAPVIGIAQSGPQIAADRYSYLSCLGWAVLAAAGLLYCWQLWVTGRIRRLTFVLAGGLAVWITAALGILTSQQVWVWHDSESLWGQALSVGPSKFAHNNLANVLADRGQADKAIEHYREALRVDPNYVPAHHNLGLVLAGRGELEKAMEHYREALRIQPSYAETHANLATALLSRGEVETAINHYRIALRLNPADAKVHNNLGLALARQGELAEAIEHFHRALRLSTAGSQAHLIHFNLGAALSKRGLFEEAVDQFQQALRIRPEFAEARDSLAQALAQRGKKSGERKTPLRDRSDFEGGLRR